MKAVKPLLSIAVMLFAFATFAETIVFAPGNGETTNVAERLAPVDGITVNEGAIEGGVVNLTNPLNGTIGSATVNCGTLSMAAIRRAGQQGGLGSLVLRNGTFRYKGSAATTTDMDILLSTAASNDAAVVWCDGNLKTMGKFDAEKGAMIKTGPGTLTIATTGRTDNTWQNFSHSRSGTNWNWIMNMKENGDSPTQAYGNLTVREGHLVIDTAAAVTTVLGGNPDAYDQDSRVLCGCRSGLGGDAEPYGHLDIKGGTVYQNGVILVGYYGATSDTPPAVEKPGSSFNIYGGNFKRIGSSQNSVNVGYMNTDASGDPAGFPVATPSFNVYGGNIDYVMYTRLAMNRGSRGKMLVAGTTVTGHGLYGAHDNGGISADDEYIPHAEAHICSNGVLAVNYIQPCRQGYCDFTLKVTDGGTLRLNQGIIPNADYPGNPTRVILDGGRVLLSSANYEVLPSSIKTRLGTKISTIESNIAGTYSFGTRFEKDPDLVPSGSADGGLRLIGYSTTTFVFNGGLEISGPLSVNGASVSVGNDSTVGEVVAEESDLYLGFGWTGSRFAVLTSEVWSVSGVTRVTFSGEWTAGSYDLVSLPSDASLDVSRIKLRTASDTSAATFATRTENGRLVLSVTLSTRSVSSYEWTNSAGGTWGDGTNWGDGTGSAPGGSSAVALFSTASAAAGTAVTLADAVTIGGLTFSASPGYAISGAALTLDNAGGPAIVSATAGSNEITASVAMAGETALNAAAGATLAVSGAIYGYGPFTANRDLGAGTVVLSGQNAFTSVPYAKAGTLRVDSVANGGTSSAIGAGTSVKVGTATFEYAGAAPGTTDRAFDMAYSTSWGTKSSIGVESGSSLTMTGPINVASGTVFAKSGAGTLNLGYSGGYSFTYGLSVDGGTLALVGNGLVVAHVNSSYSATVASGAVLSLGSGTTLLTKSLAGAGSILWNGGTWKPLYTAAFSASSNLVGANGAKIDISEMTDQVLTLGGSWNAAAGVASDGGVTVSSSRPATNNKLNTVAFVPTATYGFSGSVTLASGGVAKTTGAALAGNSVIVQANGALAAAMSGTAAEEATVKSLTLADGASVFAYISGANVCATIRATDTLAVDGNVYVALCAGSGIPDMATTAGTYAILRGPKGTLDASKFAISPRYHPATGTFALDTSDEAYDQITFTLASASLYDMERLRDFNRDYTWIGGSGSWTDAANWDVGAVPEDASTSRVRTIFPASVPNGARISLGGGNRMMQRLLTETTGELWLTDGTVYSIGSGEYAFIKTTSGTLHLPDVLCDKWRGTYIDSAAGSTQIVEGVFSNAERNMKTYVNNYAKPGGVLRFEGPALSPFYVYSGTLAGRADSFDAAFPISIQNSTFSITTSGDVGPGIIGEGTSGANGMNLHIADGAEVMFLQDVSCSGPFVKTGGGTAILSGSGTVTLGTASRSSGDTSLIQMPEGGTLPSVGLGSFTLAAGKIVLGLDPRQEVNVTGPILMGTSIADFDAAGDVLDAELEIFGGTLKATGDINIGCNAGIYRKTRDCGDKKRNLTLTMHDGNLEFNGIYMSYDPQGYYNGEATINLYGGTMKSNGAYVNLSHTETKVAKEHGTAKCVVNIYGGMFTNTVTLNGGVYPGGIGNFELNMYGGDFAWTDKFYIYGGRSGFAHNFNLHGGTFTAKYLTRREPYASVNFYWNGGAFRPTQDEASFKMANPAGGTYAWTSNVVSTNGAAFDIPGANTFTLNQAFTHDAALGATRDGGIRKRGTGTLLLSEANTFTGPCVAEAGVMRPTIATAVSGGVGASGSGVFDMNGFDLTVPELVGEGGLVTNGALTVTGRVYTESFVKVDTVAFGAGTTFASNGENYIKVLSSAEGSIVVDFGRDESDPLPRYYAVKVAEIPTGSHLYVTGVNTGRIGRWEITGERRNEADGVVEIWAVLKPVGSMLILR